MKNLKYVIIAVLVTFVLSAYADEYKSVKKIYKISLQNAIKDPGLVHAMYQQIPENFIKDEKPHYVAVVSYRHRIYAIHGSLRAWKLFFLMDPGPGGNKIIFHD